ncbi:hypothetical protein JXA12_02310 [Candidatus Woesearchaeota archaeon]|nr:hypothetical protein [Candidatus Woesearchaeota archaeon]
MQSSRARCRAFGHETIEGFLLIRSALNAVHYRMVIGRGREEKEAYKSFHKIISIKKINGARTAANPQEREHEKQRKTLPAQAASALTAPEQEEARHQHRHHQPKKNPQAMNNTEETASKRAKNNSLFKQQLVS